MEELFEDNDGSIELKKPISVQDILNGGTTFEVNFSDFKEEEDEDPYKVDELLNVKNLDVLGVHDEDVYEDQEPFERLAEKMNDILPNGMVKKRIIREGYGMVIPSKSIAYIDYNAYMEYNEIPFDSTYLRKKPYSFRLGEGGSLPGIEIGVETMRINEKAQFLVKPDYAYGKIGCLKRVPPNSTILFEIELKKFVNSGDTISYETLSPEEQAKFKEVNKFALGQCEKAKDLVVNRKNYKAAIREYNIAVSRLEVCITSDYEEQEEQQKLLLRLYTNLVVCYNKIEQPRKTCINVNKIMNMCRGTNLTVPTKVFYNSAKALIMLNDLDMAEKRLKSAARSNYERVEFVQLYTLLNKLKQEQKERDARFAKILISGKTKQEVGDEFKKLIRDLCCELKQSHDSHQYTLPTGLSKDEVYYAKTAVAEHHFTLECFKRNNTDFYSIVRPQQT